MGRFSQNVGHTVCIKASASEFRPADFKASVCAAVGNDVPDIVPINDAGDVQIIDRDLSKLVDLEEGFGCFCMLRSGGPVFPVFLLLDLISPWLILVLRLLYI